MRRELSVRTVVVVALLLPGLVMAAPIAGSCGVCGDGEDCHMQRPVEPSNDFHACCDAESETPPEPALASSNCECGRDAPPALTAASPTTVETAFTATSTLEDIDSTAPIGAAFADSTRPPPPPPAPPAYLIDCAFLT